MPRVAPTKLPAHETSTADVREPDLPEVKMPPLGEALPERGDTQIALPDSHIDKDYLAELAFMEEPVTIRIEPANEENAAWTVDCWVQGKGAEVLKQDAQRVWMENGSLPGGHPWLELNCLPVGVVCTTKRKYVEVLARSKTMRVKTPDHADGRNIDNNNVTRTHVRGHVFSVIKDSGKGSAWLTRLLNEAF
jgi:hypothetical protein